MAIEDLIGRVAVVTGAASGLGSALAERFAAEGMRLVLADVETAPLESLVERLVDDGATAIGVPTDVTDAAAVDALARSAVDAFGTAHVVCNNAGVGGHHYPTWEAPLAYWEWVLSVSVWGVIHGVRSFLPILLAQNEGHVVNTASVGGLVPVPYSAPSLPCMSGPGRKPRSPPGKTNSTVRFPAASIRKIVPFPGVRDEMPGWPP